MSAALAASVALTAAIAGAPPASAAAHQRQGGPAGTGIPASAYARLSAEMQGAWQITKGDGVVVAILNSGVDSVSGLTGKIITGPDYAPVPNPTRLEGTLLASLIAGSGPNQTSSLGFAGRAPGVRILSVRIIEDSASGRKYQRDGTWQVLEAKAIRYAVQHGAKVIATRESGYTENDELVKAVEYAISKNVVVLGNSYVFGTPANAEEYPDDLPGVINVSGKALRGLPGPMQKGQPFPDNFSVLVTTPSNTMHATGPADAPYSAYNDLATVAWLAGTVALIKSVYPRISPALIARALAMSASYHPPGGYNTKIGFGLINPIGALRAAGQLLKLSATAVPGTTAVSPVARLAGPAPGAINAVEHSRAKLAALAGPVAGGLVLLLLAILLGVRWRRKSAAATRASRSI